MLHIQENAEVAVRDMLTEFGRRVKAKTGKSQLSAFDFMDDGSKINLSVNIDLLDGTAVFDFTGTGTQVWGNTNAPRAVAFSALIYSLRCLVGHEIPLNQGCLNPVKVIIPEGSILDPDEDRAVIGGNVLTSQRLVDVCLRAFEACAASQGCCNNVTFGDNEFGYTKRLVDEKLQNINTITILSKLLRNCCWRFWRRSHLARPFRCPRPHDQHSLNGPRDLGEALPGDLEAL